MTLLQGVQARAMSAEGGRQGWGRGGGAGVAGEGRGGGLGGCRGLSPPRRTPGSASVVSVPSNWWPQVSIEGKSMFLNHYVGLITLVSFS